MPSRGYAIVAAARCGEHDQASEQSLTSACKASTLGFAHLKLRSVLESGNQMGARQCQHASGKLRLQHRPAKYGGVRRFRPAAFLAKDKALRSALRPTDAQTVHEWRLRASAGESAAGSGAQQHCWPQRDGQQSSRFLVHVAFLAIICRCHRRKAEAAKQSES